MLGLEAAEFAVGEEAEAGGVGFEDGLDEGAEGVGAVVEVGDMEAGEDGEGAVDGVFGFVLVDHFGGEARM